MKYQQKEYWCGPASIQNALALLGKRVPAQSAVARLCGTTSEGTDEFQMMRGLRELGLSYHEFWLTKPVRIHGVSLVCVDSWSHWVAAMSPGMLSCWNHMLMIDPARTKRNQQRNGVHVISWHKFKKLWGCAFKSENRAANQPAYYAIEVMS